MSRWNVDRWLDGTDVVKIIYSSPNVSRYTATSHIVQYWYRITCPSLWKHNVCINAHLQQKWRGPGYLLVHWSHVLGLWTIHLRLCRNGQRFFAANRSCREPVLQNILVFYLFCTNINECQCAICLLHCIVFGRAIKVGVTWWILLCLFIKIINVIEINLILVTYTHLIVSMKPALGHCR